MNLETLTTRLTTHLGRKPSSSLLRVPAAECYGNNSPNVRTNFNFQFSNGRNEFRYRMEVEHCMRGDEEEIRNILHRIKRTVDKGWPDDVNGFEAAQQKPERDVQAREERRQWYINYSLKGLRFRYLQRKAQEYPMVSPNNTCNNFSILNPNISEKSHVVSSTTTDATIKDLSDFCTLNYWGLGSRTLINLRFPDLASISSTSPP